MTIYIPLSHDLSNISSGTRLIPKFGSLAKMFFSQDHANVKVRMWKVNQLRTYPQTRKRIGDYKIARSRGWVADTFPICTSITQTRLPSDQTDAIASTAQSITFIHRQRSTARGPWKYRRGYGSGEGQFVLDVILQVNCKLPMPPYLLWSSKQQEVKWMHPLITLSMRHHEEY